MSDGSDYGKELDYQAVWEPMDPEEETILEEQLQLKYGKKIFFY